MDWASPSSILSRRAMSSEFGRRRSSMHAISKQHRKVWYCWLLLSISTPLAVGRVTWVPLQQALGCPAACDSAGGLVAVASGTRNTHVCAVFSGASAVPGTVYTHSEAALCYYFSPGSSFRTAAVFQCLCAAVRDSAVWTSRGTCRRGYKPVYTAGSDSQGMQVCRARAPSRLSSIVGFLNPADSTHSSRGLLLQQQQQLEQQPSGAAVVATRSSLADASPYSRRSVDYSYSYCQTGVPRSTDSRAFAYDILCSCEDKPLPSRPPPPPPPVSPAPSPPAPTTCDGPPPGSPEHSSGWPAACAGQQQAGFSCVAECLPGYEGQVKSSCRQGSWTTPAGQCTAAARCAGLPAPLLQGSWPDSCSDAAAGAQCEADCNVGFRQPPPPVATCLPKGTWSSRGKCGKRDPAPCPGEPNGGVNPPNAQWPGNCDNLPHTGVCYAVCDAGFAREPRPSAECEDGRWLPVQGECQQ